MFNVDCTQIASESASYTCVATQSASIAIDISEGSQIGVAMQGVSMVLWWGLALIILMQAVKIGLIWFRG